MACILVVEDDTNLRNVVCDVLRQAEYEVHVAANGRKAAELLRTEHVDLMITDILMPDKEGIETIADTRRHCRGIRIIAMSGGGKVGADHCLEMAREFGADLTLLKPFTKADLLRAVNSLIGPAVVAS